jgi:hypothetical protein
MRTFAKTTSQSTTPYMSQQPNIESLSREDRLVLALQALKSDASLSQRRAADIYNVHESTLRNRRARTASRRDIQPNRSRLQKHKQETVIQYIRKLDARGFAPTINYVQHMANQLLAARSSSKVGVNWAANFIRRNPEVKSQITRQRDHQRVLCSDPAIISPWFDLVRNVKAKYSILDEDTYNFDETGFQMGVGGSVKVVTASERRLKPIGVQPGNREWVTLIAAINAAGWVIPPFLIFKAKNHDQAWYHNPPDWRIGVSSNGWTTNELGLEWLKHFIHHTSACTVGVYRLLILDGHESHKSLAFQTLCEESKIITLCMPAHASHILQPLDVGCFAPLKRAYKQEVGALANCGVNHIDKRAFLDAFKPVFKRSFSKNNIQSSFRATGLVPLDPEVVISRLEVKPHTPTTPPPGSTAWQPKTPSNALELEAQTTLILKRIRAHKSSSPESIIEMVLQVKKGSAIKVHTNTLLEARIAALEQANNAATERKKRKKKRLQKGGTLSQAEAEDLITQRETKATAAEERRKERLQDSSSRGVRRCRSCGEVGHNKRTCKQDRADIEE